MPAHSSPDAFFTFAGLYEVSEAARIVNVTSRLPERVARITNRQVLSWIRKGLAQPRLGELHGSEILLSFEDLVSMRAIALMRAVGITWRKIYEAEKWLRTYTGNDRPFATQFLWTSGQEVFSERQGSLIAASMGGQYPFQELLEDYLIPVAGMSFSASGVAEEWTPREHVSLNPAVQFGAPCIKGTRITTSAIASMHKGGDSEDFIARVYKLGSEQIRDAIQWEKSLATAA